MTANTETLKQLMEMYKILEDEPEIYFLAGLRK